MSVEETGEPGFPVEEVCVALVPVVVGDIVGWDKVLDAEVGIWGEECEEVGRLPGPVLCEIWAGEDSASAQCRDKLP